MHLDYTFMKLEISTFSALFLTLNFSLFPVHFLLIRQ